ncbi:hypothetical protein EYF80_051400 [Liparis tanakae]|uniref:Uncharacterized protein n=1 Tax=Liparis tanakae TaxID=230148 RepID=A0A4Z2FCD7_9TELE|nr:hypothetical protein EYF80_051400 [Liparis tanakae]
MFHHPDLHPPSGGGREEEWAESQQWAESHHDQSRAAAAARGSCRYTPEDERRAFVSRVGARLRAHQQTRWHLMPRARC